MVVETAPAAAQPTLFERSRKPQPSVELACEYVFRPLAHLVVVALLPLRVSPPAVVAASAASGIATAVELGRGHLLVAALLLQLKTVLDNADGQLARASGRMSVFGRYLDSEADLLVNAALFAALGWQTGSALGAVAAFVLVTTLVGINFNLKHLFRRAHGEAAETMPAATGPGSAVLLRVYRVVYAPQDRLLAWFSARRVRRLGASPREYHDATTLAVVAQLGLSTQLLALGVCLALGRPLAFCWLLVAEAALLVPLELRRGHRSKGSASWS